MQGAVVGQIADQRAALLGFLGTVPAEGWSMPTVCTGWSVKDVLAHLVEGELNAGRLYRGEVTGPGFPDPEDGVGRWRALPGEAVRGALWQHGTATQRVLEAMTEVAWGRRIEAFGCRSIGQLVRLQLFEGVVHSHDVTDALGAGPVWGDRLGAIVEHCVRAAPRTYGRGGFAPEGALGVRVGERSWVIEGRGGEWRVEADADPRSAPASLTVEPDDLVLATTGRRQVEEVLARARVDGDRRLAERFLRAW